MGTKAFIPDFGLQVNLLKLNSF